MWHLQLPDHEGSKPMEEQNSPTLTAAKIYTDKADLKKPTKEFPKDKSESAAASQETMDRELIEKKYPIGTMIWGKLPGYDWWPGVLLSYSDGTNNGGGGGEKKEVTAATSTEEQQLSDDEDNSGNVVRVWVKWYGDNQLSQVSLNSFRNLHLI